MSVVEHVRVMGEPWARKRETDVDREILGAVCVCVCVCVDNHPPHRIHVRVCRVDLVQRRYDTVDLYSGVNSNELLRLAFQARDQIAAFLSTCTVVA